MLFAILRKERHIAHRASGWRSRRLGLASNRRCRLPGSVVRGPLPSGREISSTKHWILWHGHGAPETPLRMALAGLGSVSLPMGVSDDRRQHEPPFGHKYSPGHK